MFGVSLADFVIPSPFNGDDGVRISRDEESMARYDIVVNNCVKRVDL